MTVSLRFSRQAQRDLIDIWRWVAVFNVAAAEAIVDRIEDACRLPAHGPASSHLAAHGRVLIVDRWLVLYRTKPSEVFIVRILDGRRNLNKIIPSPSI